MSVAKLPANPPRNAPETGSSLYTRRWWLSSMAKETRSAFASCVTALMVAGWYASNQLVALGKARSSSDSSAGRNVRHVRFAPEGGEDQNRRGSQSMKSSFADPGDEKECSDA